MSRVKFNVNTEYAYLQNFKILQSKLLLGVSKLGWELTLYLRSLLYQTPDRAACSR